VAHFAELDNNSVVLRVIVVSNADTSTPDGTEIESIGVAFCQRLFGGNWRQTSYNGNFRKRYAGIGYTYNSQLDAFIPPKPYPSWVLNETTADWEAPVPYPTDGKVYFWDEGTLSWQLVEPQPGE
jgi:hypothetical protein